jgi:hypothetical protein
MRIPLRSTRSVSTEPHERDGLRVGRASVPFSDIRAGRFRSDGPKRFSPSPTAAACSPSRSTARPPWADQDLAAEADDPVALAAEVERRLAAHGLH